MKSVVIVSIFFSILFIFVLGTAFSYPSVDGAFGLAEWSGYYADGDDVIGPGVGGQAYDVEYLGLYINSDTVFFGLQTGFDLVNGRDFGSLHFGPGDFALDIGNDGSYEYAIRFIYGGSGVTYSLYKDVTWYAPYYPAHNVASPFRMEHGTEIAGGIWETGFSNPVSPGDSWVLEGGFDRSLLDELGSDFQDTVTIHWTMQCGNDYLNQSVTVNPVPEPATIFLLGMGMIGLAVTSRSKVLKKG